MVESSPRRALSVIRDRARGVIVRGMLSTAAAMIATGPISAQIVPPAVDPVSSAQLPYRFFDGNDGLPGNTVHAIALDSQSRLWIGTQDGLAMWNGREWAQVDLPRRGSRFVRAIVPTADGALWIGTESEGLFRYDDGIWQSWRDELPTPRFNALSPSVAPDGQVELWGGNYGGGLVRIRRNADDAPWSITVWGEEDGLPSAEIWGLYAEPGPDGTTVWVGTEGGVARLDPGADRLVSGDPLPRDSVNGFARTEGPDGPTLWASSWGGGLLSWDGARWTRSDTSTGFPHDRLTSLVADPRSEDLLLWIGTDGGGLIRYDGDTAEVLNRAGGLTSTAVYSLLVTTQEEGGSALWIGLRFGGIAALYESPWRAVIPRQDLPNLSVRTIATENLPNDEMVLWVGTDGGGLARWQRGEWRTWTTENSIMRSDTVQAVSVVQREDRPSEVWFGVRYGGLLRLVGDRMTLFNSASGHLPHDNVQGIMVRDDVEPRELWIATRGGVVRQVGGQWTAFGRADGLPNPSSAAMVVAPRPDSDEPTVWLGTAGGLAYHDPPGWRVIPNPEGFPDLRILSLAGTRHAEGGTTLWCGTSSGVFLYDLRDGGIHDAGFLTPDSTPSIPAGTIQDIVAMGLDRVALLTNRGVLDITRRAGQGFDDPIRYGVDHGLPIAETTDLSGHVDARGRLWIGTLRGAAVYDPTAQSRDLFADQLLLDRSVALRPDGSSIPMIDGTALPADADRVIFEYRLRTLLGDQQQFRTQLVGLEALPTRWTRTSRREFSSLPPGQHEFRVWGRDRSGNVSEPVTMCFSLAAPWWETLWFRAGTPAVLALIGLGVFQWRTRAIRANEALLEATVRERTESLARANEMLEDLALLDPLMGIGNRRRFDRRLEEEWRRAERSGQTLGLILIDVDHFKQYNDSRGHQAGDHCLRAIGSIVREWARRPGDDACRYGGEELALLLPSADSERCRTVAEALRLEIRDLGPPLGPVTISSGVAAVIPSRDQSPADLVERADQALYAAKQRGRDRTVTADEMESTP